MAKTYEYLQHWLRFVPEDFQFGKKLEQWRVYPITTTSLNGNTANVWSLSSIFKPVYKQINKKNDRGFLALQIKCYSYLCQYVIFPLTFLLILFLPRAPRTLNDSTNASKAAVLQIKSVLLYSLCMCDISFQNQSDWHYLICTGCKKSILCFSPLSTQSPGSQTQLKLKEIGAWCSRPGFVTTWSATSRAFPQWYITQYKPLSTK